MAIQADDLVEKLGAKAIHHAHDNNQRGDAEHDRHKADRRDKEDEPLALAGEQIAPCDHAFIGGEDHANCALRALMKAGNSTWPVAQ